MRRVIIFLTLSLLLAALAFGGAWASYKKPWLMDDFRAGYAAAEDGNFSRVGKDPCAEAMASKYGAKPSWNYESPDDQSAFYLGCLRAVGGASNDWWNVSGYLTA